MKGKQRREEPMFACVRLEELIPLGHILRKIDRWIDFSIIHEKTEDLYSNTGRPRPKAQERGPSTRASTIHQRLRHDTWRAAPGTAAVSSPYCDAARLAGFPGTIRGSCPHPHIWRASRPR